MGIIARYRKPLRVERGVWRSGRKREKTRVRAHAERAELRRKDKYERVGQECVPACQQEVSEQAADRSRVAPRRRGVRASPTQMSRFFFFFQDI